MNNKKNSYILKSEDFNFILSYEGFSFNDEHRLKNFISNFNHNISLEFSKELIKDIKNNCNDRLPIVDIYDKKFWNAIYFKGRSEVIKLAHYFKPKGFNLWQKFMDDCVNENQKLSTSYNSLLFDLAYHLNSNKTDFIPEPEKIIVIVNKLLNLKQKNVTPCILDFLKYCTTNSENFDSKEILDLFFSLQKQYSSFPKFSFKKNKEISLKLEELFPSDWNLALSQDSELKKKLDNSEANIYTTIDCISKKWSFDINLLSIKNGSFGINNFKNNYYKLQNVINNYSNNNNNNSDFCFFFSMNESFLTLVTSAQDNTLGKKQIEVVNNFIHIVFENSIKNIKLDDDNTQKMWDSLKLMLELNNKLSVNDIQKKSNEI